MTPSDTAVLVIMVYKLCAHGLRTRSAFVIKKETIARPTEARARVRCQSYCCCVRSVRPLPRQNLRFMHGDSSSVEYVHLRMDTQVVDRIALRRRLSFRRTLSELPSLWTFKLWMHPIFQNKKAVCRCQQVVADVSSRRHPRPSSSP